MSQRNPMNDRYQTDDHSGKTRKSAASAKPKTKAASTVTIPVKQKQKKGFFSGKTREQRNEERRFREEQRQITQKYYNPPTREYKMWRRIWWALIVLAVACGVLTLVLSLAFDANFVVLVVLLILTYGFAIGSVVLDSTKIRKLRTEYQNAMITSSKDAHAELKALHAQERAEKRAKEEAAKNAPAPQRRGLFGGGSRSAK